MRLIKIIKSLKQKTIRLINRITKTVIDELVVFGTILLFVKLFLSVKTFI